MNKLLLCATLSNASKGASGRLMSRNIYRTSTLWNSVLSSLHDDDINNRKNKWLLVEQRREFGRKAGRMGQHLKKLEEMSHDQDRQRAKSTKKMKQTMEQQTEEEELTEEEEDDTYEDMHHEADELPDTDLVEEHMMNLVQSMETNLRSIRGSEPTPELFDSIPVLAYGTSTPLNSVAQVVVVSPTLVTVTCFDPSNATAVRDAIRDNMSNNPYVEDGGQVTVPIPKASAETRQQIAKQLSQLAETTRQRIRRVRRNAQQIVKLAKDGKMEGISKDDAFRVGKAIDASTENAISIVNETIDKKKESILTL